MTTAFAALLTRILNVSACSRQIVALLSAVVALSGCIEPNGLSHEGLAVVGIAEHYFGECAQGGVVRHTFVLANRSNETLQISELRSSCGCLVAGDDNGFAMIQPGEEVNVPVQLKITTQTSEASGQVLVYYKRPSHSQVPEEELHYVALRVRAAVESDYVLEPMEIDFGVIGGSESDTPTRSLLVRPAARADLEVTSVASSDSRLSVDSAARNGPAAAFAFNVALDINKCIGNGRIAGFITLHTNSTRVPTATVPFTAQYRSPVNLDPKAIIIGSNCDGAVTRELVITTKVPSKIHIASIGNKGMVSVEEFNPGISRNHTLRVTVQPTIHPIDAPVRLTVELLTLHRSVAVEVPIHRFPRKDSL